MKQFLDKLKEFNKAFNIGPQHHELRFKLMKEENEEYMDAESSVDVADAVGDMLYILCGTIINEGLEDKIEDIFNEIHRSNMSKLDANGNPIYREDGKVLKGPDYFKPDLKSILF